MTREDIIVAKLVNDKDGYHHQVVGSFINPMKEFYASETVGAVMSPMYEFLTNSTPDEKEKEIEKTEENR